MYYRPEMVMFFLQKDANMCFQFFISTLGISVEMTGG